MSGHGREIGTVLAGDVLFVHIVYLHYEACRVSMESATYLLSPLIA